MAFIKKYIGDLFISPVWYLLLTGCVLLYFVSFFAGALFHLVTDITAVILVLTFADYCLLFFSRDGIISTRVTAQRFSIGDQNNVTLKISNTYRFRVKCRVVDELPFQFQVRDFDLRTSIGYKNSTELSYTLRPLSRGEFEFGRVIVYAASPLGLLMRRFATGPDKGQKGMTVKVYPAYLQLKKYQLMATADVLPAGLKKVRRLGHSLEFEKIKDYVQGDDVRTINWKATARTSQLMVNTYTDARQQMIYCLLDKGRNMKMPFDGLTLLDHSINAALALLNVALLRQDKAGLITFSSTVNDIIAADRRNDQMLRIIDALYHQQTDFKESDYEAVWSAVHRGIRQRSLVMLFTNFETHSSMERQLPFLAKIAQRHLVCVVFFQNTLLREIHNSHPNTIEGIYIKTIADQFDLEKRLIVKELRRHGILAILTTPQDLTVDVVNRYLELKARQML